jgi:hypothetical protein
MIIVRQSSKLSHPKRREDYPLLPKIARHEPQENIIETEYEMPDEFKGKAIPHLRIMPENHWEWLTVALGPQRISSGLSGLSAVPICDCVQNCDIDPTASAGA